MNEQECFCMLYNVGSTLESPVKWAFVVIQKRTFSFCGSSIILKESQQSCTIVTVNCKSVVLSRGVVCKGSLVSGWYKGSGLPTAIAQQPAKSVALAKKSVVLAKSSHSNNVQRLRLIYGQRCWRKQLDGTGLQWLGRLRLQQSPCSSLPL